MARILIDSVGLFERGVSDGLEKFSHINRRVACARCLCSKAGNSDLKAEKPLSGFWAWFKMGSGTVAQSTPRARGSRAERCRSANAY